MNVLQELLNCSRNLLTTISLLLVSMVKILAAVET